MVRIEKKSHPAIFIQQDVLIPKSMKCEAESSWLQCLYRCENQWTGCSSLFTHSKCCKCLLPFVLFFWLFVTFLFRNSSFLLVSPSLFRDLFLRVWHWFDYTTSSEKPETQSYEDNSALQISFVIFRLDNWRERSLSFSRRSEYRSIVIQYERRPKFLFGNSSATPVPVSRGSLSTHASAVSSFTFFVSGQEVKHKTCFYYFATTEA